MGHVRACRTHSTRPTDQTSMSIKSDRWIRRMALEHGMIEPFEDRQVREGVVSYGLSSYGYDIRVADEFKVFTNINSTVVDPRQYHSHVATDALRPPVAGRR